MTLEDKIKYVLGELAKSPKPRTVASILTEETRDECLKVREHLLYHEFVRPERKTHLDFHLQINTKGRRALKGLEPLGL